MNILYLAILFVLGMVTIEVTSPAFGQVEGGGPVRTAHYQFSDMASVGNNVYVLYQENAVSGSSHIFFRKSPDVGHSFDSPIRLDNKSGNSPLVAASGNNVYVAWLDKYGGYPPSQVLFSKSTDDGKIFSNPIVLDGNLSANSFVTRLVADGSDVHAVITEADEDPPYDTRVYLMTSHDNGTTFGDKVQLLPVSGHLMTFDISMQKVENTIYVSGEDEIGCSANPNVCTYDILLWKSTDDGETFENPVRITDAVNPTDLHMYSTGNYVYVIWNQLAEGDVGLFFAKSSDGGHSFSIPTTIGKKPGGYLSPHMVASGKNLYVIYTYGNAMVVNKMPFGFKPPVVTGMFFVQSHDSGNTFSQPLDVSGEVGTSYFSDIAESGENVYVTWGTIFGDRDEVFFRKSTDYGNTFGDVTKMTDTNPKYFLEQMSVYGSNVHVAIGTALPGNDLYLVSSKDGGASFGDIVTLNHDSMNMTGPESRNLGPPLKIPPVQVYPENSTDDLYNTIILAGVGVPIFIGIVVGILLFTRKRK